MKRLDVSAIYSLTTIPDRKKYIGGSRKVRARERKHFKDLQKGNHPIQGIQITFNQFGKLSVEFSIIEIVAIEDLAERERYWITKLKTQNPKYGYNRYNGGTGIQLKAIVSPAISEANTRRWADPEYNARVSAAISEAKKGKSNGPHRPEVVAKIKVAHQARAHLQRGIKLKPETCAKMSASRLGKKRGPYKGSKAWRALYGEDV